MAIYLFTLAAGMGLLGLAVLALFLEVALKPVPARAGHSCAGGHPARRGAARSFGAAIVPVTTRARAVPVTAAEALAIATELRAQTNGDLLAVAARNAAAIVQDLQRGATGAVTRCALLIGGHCCVVRARPSACQHCAALASRAECTPQQLAPVDAPLYELNHAVLIALGTPQAETRWATEKDLFSDCTLVA